MEQEPIHNQESQHVTQGSIKNNTSNYFLFGALGGISVIFMLFVASFLLLEKNEQNTVDVFTESGTSQENPSFEVAAQPSMQAMSEHAPVNENNAPTYTNQQRQFEAMPNTRYPTEESRVAASQDETQHFKLTDFKDAQKRWFQRFSSNPVPTGAFRAYYFDSTKPNTILKTEIVPKVAISYAWDKGDGFTVRSEDFGAYWIGNVVIRERGVYTVSIAESWSTYRVIINGHEIPIRSEMKIDMEPGTYQIEVEYLNNWHTTDFAMNFEKDIQVTSFEEVQEKIKMHSGEYDVWYVAAYESANTKRTISVNLQKKSTRPAVLLLSSYSQVHWEIQNTSNINILYILYSSYEPGTSVTASLDASKILKLGKERLPYEYTIKVDCYDVRDVVFHCEHIDGLTKIDASVQALIGRKIDSFSGLYNPGSITVPEQIITEAVRANIIQSYEDVRKKREDSVRSQQIQNLFD